MPDGLSHNPLMLKHGGWRWPKYVNFLSTHLQLPTSLPLPFDLSPFLRSLLVLRLSLPPLVTAACCCCIDLQLIEEEEEEVEVSMAKESSDMEKALDDVPTTNETDLIGKEKEVEVPVAKDSFDMDKAPANVPTTNETDVEPPKKKIKRSLEFIMLQDVMKKCKDKKKAVEAYVNGMRNELLYRKMQLFVTDPERKAFLARLQETEDWLNEDGKDEKEDVYTAKLEELMKQGEFIEQRLMEDLDRRETMFSLCCLMDSFNRSEYAHVDSSEKKEVLSKCEEVKQWLFEKTREQALLPKDADPVLLVSDLKMKIEEFERMGRSLLTRNPAAASSSGSAEGGEQQPPENANDNPDVIETEKPQAAA